METTSYIISIIAVLASILALLVTLRQFNKRKKAEQKLYKLMKEKYTELKISKETTTEFQKNYKISKEKLLQLNEFKKLNQVIEDLVLNMNEADREKIQDGLEQRSFDNKLDYLNKLLIQSGSTESNIFKTEE